MSVVIDEELPVGLLINQENGDIYGIPLKVQDLIKYNITIVTERTTYVTCVTIGVKSIFFYIRNIFPYNFIYI